MNARQRDYAARREMLLRRIVESLRGDERFVAAWLGGSLGRGDADAVSDIDLSAVVSYAHSQALCARDAAAGAQPSTERLELFREFGQPIIVHENNNNAPDGGTFTFVLYYPPALMVDWTLIPHSSARRPTHSLLLFDQAAIPAAPASEPESPEQRARMASDAMAFFWMMAAVTAKYVVRGDDVFVTCWLEELLRLLREVKRLVAGEAPLHRHGSLGVLECTRPGQTRTLLQLCDEMSELLPRVAALGYTVVPSPKAAIEALLSLREDT